MPASTPACWTAASCVDCPSQAEDAAGERLEDQILGAVCKHRHEDEYGEPARFRLRPDLGQGRTETRPGLRRLHR